jgi:hypothetical protein
MRSLPCLALGALFFLPRTVAGKPQRPNGPPRASLQCATSAGENLAGRSRLRLTEPVVCTVAMVSDGGFNAVVQVRGKERSGPDRYGHAELKKPLRVELRPGSDFVACSDFEVLARLEDDRGKVLWSQKLAVRQGCVAKKIKADFSCSAEHEGKSLALPNRSNPRIQASIRCALTSKDAALAQARATLAVDAGARHVLKAAEPVAEGAGWAARFDLAPGADFVPCARSMALTAEVSIDGAPAYSKVIAIQQDCSE